MKCYKFGLRTCICLVAFVVTLKPDVINGQSSAAVQKFPGHFLNVVPNPSSTHNLLLAPMAVRSSLLLASYVAKRETKDELETALYKENSTDLVKYLKQLKDENGWKVRVFVNSDPRADIPKCLRKKISDLIEDVNFSHRKHAEKQANDWISKRTNNFITKLPSRKFKRPFVSLVQVEYFEAKWKYPFPSAFRGKDSVVLGNKTLSDVLYQTKALLYRKLHKLGVEALEMPLTNNARMLVLKPLKEQEPEDFKSLKKKLRNVDFTKISQSLRKTWINLFFPELSTVKMSRPFEKAQELGIHQAFDRDTANFDKFHCCGRDSYIKDIYQESKLSLLQHSLQVATAINVRFSFKYAISNTKITAEEEEEEEEEVKEEQRPKRTGGKKPPITSIPNVYFDKFIYVIIKDDIPLFMGTVVRYSNI